MESRHGSRDDTKSATEQQALAGRRHHNSAGLIVLQATLCFWTTESLEIMNTVTYGGVETAQYPLVIYRVWFRRFFTFVVPLACVSYYPTLGLLGRADPLGSPTYVHWLAPLVGFCFLAFSLQIWNIGVRHYRSTGS